MAFVKVAVGHASATDKHFEIAELKYHLSDCLD